MVAHVTQAIKKQLQPKIRNLLQNNNLRGSLSIRDHCMLVLKIKDTNRFNLFTKDCAKGENITFASENVFSRYLPGFFNVNSPDASEYGKRVSRLSEENRKLLTNIFNAMKVPGWIDNTRSEIDYFEITYYIELLIIKDFE